MNEALAKALLAAQKEMPSLVRDSTNPDFQTRYLSLGKLVEAVYPVLHKHGLFVIQAPTTVNGQPALTTIISTVEAAAEIESTMLLMQSRNDPQGQGSAITYARRYALMGMLGLVADEDDDGNSARGAPVADHANVSNNEKFFAGRDMLPNMPRGDDAVERVSQMQQAIDPTVDWGELLSVMTAARHGGKMWQEISREERVAFMHRWANAITRLSDSTNGDFPPLTDETIQDALKWAFEGTAVEVPHLVASQESA